MQDPWATGPQQKQAPKMNAADEMNAWLQSGSAPVKDPNMAPYGVRAAANIAIAGAAGMVLLGLLGFTNSTSTVGTMFGGFLLSLAFGAGFLFHRDMLLHGSPKAWGSQLILCVFGLLFIPIGTVASIYILPQWFKSEVRDWFAA